MPIPLEHPLTASEEARGTYYRPVQDLREVNKWVSDIHPTVSNPYTLLSSLLPEYTWYTVLDLKDAFFSLHLAAQSQEIFAFEWTEGEGQPVVSEILAEALAARKDLNGSLMGVAM